MKPLADVLAALGALPGDWHGAGCLEMPNLEALGRHASARTIRRSVETGAGKSTILLSHLSDHHMVFAVDDGGSLTKTRASALLHHGVVEFVEGPTQHTLMAHEFSEPLQLVFIDGPHGFPFPNMEYWKLYPHLEARGLLALDDIHIPTIRQLFDFLREDEMFSLIETVGKTAFFERTQAPAFSPVEDGWWLQRYNARRFPVPYEPIDLAGGGAEAQAPAYRERLLPLIQRWVRDQARVAIFGIGGHTEQLFRNVPELDQLLIVAYLDTNASLQGSEYRGVAIRQPGWTPGNADVVLCSSYAHELAQLSMLDAIPIKAVLSHPPCRSSPRC